MPSLKIDNKLPILLPLKLLFKCEMRQRISVTFEENSFINKFIKASLLIKTNRVYVKFSNYLNDNSLFEYSICS